MSWKTLLPPKVKTSDLTLDECRNFSQFYKLLTRKLKGPIGWQIFYRYTHHLFLFGMCCIQENKFPAVTRAHDLLNGYFITPEFDNDWLVLLWLFCDFPVEEGSTETVIDYFQKFMKENPLPENEQPHLAAFCQKLKASRLGLYEEILSTKKVTRFRELFTGKVINTVRSVPDYESGEIFVGRITGYLGHKFLIHDPRNFPPAHKAMIKSMYAAKFFYVSETMDDAHDYDLFMRLTGPYTMSVTCGDPSVPILAPDLYQNFYQ
ncbi:hypothetical protein AB833_01955 [Chromatiales bacterium (ex Bugula neritina AB1)]|nr:hypothetical protein AB833_01955 [Chromatiales bacterium (ex Bugula neritina AB1)]